MDEEAKPQDSSQIMLNMEGLIKGLIAQNQKLDEELKENREMLVVLLRLDFWKILKGP